jgi:predicted nucleic acid-binding protein
VTLLDTSVIIDAFDAKSPWHSWAREQIANAVSGDGAVVNTVVLSEAAVRAENPDRVRLLLQQFGVELLPLPISAAGPAAKAFALYLERRRKEGTDTGNKIPLPDFLIGAHAQAEGLTLVTRDTERIKTYFPNVLLIHP